MIFFNFTAQQFVQGSCFADDVAIDKLWEGEIQFQVDEVGLYFVIIIFIA